MQRIYRTINIILLLAVTTCLLTACGRDNGPTGVALVGKPAPDFTLTATDGTSWTLSEHRGMVVLVNFWATWCPPCRQELPSMKAMQHELADQPFQLLSILVNDDPNQAVLVAGRTGITFPILVDSGSKIGTAYGITGVPETFIIDAKGILREKVIGPRDWNSEESKEMIRPHLP